MITSRRIATLALGLAVTMSAEATAQECLGITAGSRGYFSYGVEGTDGATGETFTVGLRLQDFTMQFQKRTLKPSLMVDDLDRTELQVAYPLARKIPLCIVGGFSWSAYDTDQVFGWGTDENGNTTTHGRAGGPYSQLRVPIGISLGKEFTLTEKFRVATFVQNSVLFEAESGEAFDGTRIHQKTLGLGVTAGLNASYGRLLLRSTISNTRMLDSSLGFYNDYPYMSLQLGVKF
jgi:hypothetical protein